MSIVAESSESPPGEAGSCGGEAWWLLVSPRSFGRQVPVVQADEVNRARPGIRDRYQRAPVAALALAQPHIYTEPRI